MDSGKKKSLDQIALETGTDKNTSIHGYTSVYERYFEHLRSIPITLMEIGVANGYSLRMWREYFPLATIVAIDIKQECLAYAENGVKVIIGDQSDKSFLMDIAKEYGPFDVVIDDGSHMFEHMVASFEALFQYVKTGGWYAIEDLHAEFTNMHGDSFTNYLKNKVDDVNMGGKHFDGWLVGDRTNQALSLQGRATLTEWEKTVSSVHFYKSLALVLKDQAGDV